MYNKQIRYLMKNTILPGVEPGISGFVDQRLIHWAIGPIIKDII